MKIKLVFYDWHALGKPVEDKIDLSMGDFHPGTTFDGTIDLDPEQEEEFSKALKDSYQPIFWVTNK